MDYTHRLSGPVAYTADNILIFKIRALVASNVSTQQITKYFKKFGKVTDICEIENNGQIIPHEQLIVLRNILSNTIFNQVTSNKEYVIQYSTAKSAARALRRNNHHIQNQPILVVACRSCDQPEGQHIIEQINKYFVNNSEDNFYNDCNNMVPILTLNDDCLEHIFKLLPLRDQINLALSCKRFASILVMFSKVHLQHLDTLIMENMTLFQIRLLLQMVGPQIKTIKADLSDMEWEGSTQDDIFSFIATFATSVKKLNVSSNSANIKNLVENMSLLEEVKLDNATFDDEFIKRLQPLKNLKKLHIFHNSSIAGAEINKLTGLEELTLMRCSEIAFHLKSICENLTNLTYLDIRCGVFEFELVTEDYQHIVRHLLKLTTLKITCKEGNYNCLAELPNLKILQIQLIGFNGGKVNEFFKNLAIHKENKLEELDISSSIFGENEATSVAKLKALKVLRCNFGLDDSVLNKFCELKNLEIIELHEMEDVTDDGILKLLESCCKLKRICMWCAKIEQTNLLPKSHKLLKNLHSRGCRTGCVNFVFKKESFMYDDDDESLTPTPDFEFSDLIKVTEELGYGDEEKDYFDADDEFYDDDDEYGYPSFGDSDVDDFFNFFHNGSEFSDSDDGDYFY